MVTISKVDYIGAKGILSLVGLSTDVLPLEEVEGHKVTNGSNIFLMDNPSIVGLFDEENKAWRNSANGSVI